jgi:hypothetical protein
LGAGQLGLDRQQAVEHLLREQRRALGAEVERTGPGAWRVSGRGVGGLLEPADVLDMGNSGTAARLLCGLLAGHLLRTALGDLMDRAPAPGLQDTVSQAALATSGVLAIEKLKIRKSGTAFYGDIHVQADPHLSLHDAHVLSGRVKSAIRQRLPAASGVLIHMEPFEPRNST